MNRLLLAAILAAPVAAIAQPAPTPAPTPLTPAQQQAKLRANALISEAIRQSDAGNRDAAIGLLEAAYREFPDSQILVNIARIQRAMGRLLEAAANFERFLADPARAESRVADVTRELAEIDTKLGRLDITVTKYTATAAEVAIDDGPWGAPPAGRVRVEPGPHRVRARGGGAVGVVEKLVEPAPGAVVTVALDLALPPPVVVEAPPPVVETPPPVVVEAPPPVVEARPVVEAPPAAPIHPGRVGATIALAFEPRSTGAAAVVTLGYAVTPRIAVNVGGMLGGNNAAHAVATFAFTTGRLRPIATVGGTLAFYRWEGSMGVLGSRSRTLPGLHAALGAEYWLSSKLGAVLEAAGEFYPTGDPDIRPLVFTPTVGVRGRL